MADRIKLTEKNIQYFIIDNIPCIGIREDEFDGDIYKVKPQILEDHEKAEKYDLIKDESLILNPNLLEENKQLKEELNIMTMGNQINEKLVIHLQQKLEEIKGKIDSHIYACNEMLKDGQNDTDEQKEISKRYTQMLKYFTELKTILKENK